MLRPDELQAFDWIEKNTRPDALFQVDPMARDSETWAYLPAFAERRMAIGLPISMVPLAKYQQGSEAIRNMFDESPLAAYERAVRARRELRVDRPARTRRTSGRRGAIQFDPEPDADCVQERNDLDLRSPLITGHGHGTRFLGNGTAPETSFRVSCSVPVVISCRTPSGASRAAAPTIAAAR